MRQETLKRELAKLMATIPAEPEADSAAAVNVQIRLPGYIPASFSRVFGYCVLVFRSPGGAKIQRRFFPDDVFGVM